MADQNHCQLLPEALDRETLLNRITSKIRQTSELPEILMTAVQEIGAFLKTERVKIYYFHPDHSGEVIAESIQDSHLPSLLGLRFPAEDIPPRAREVFLKTHARVIVDVVSGQKTVEKADCGAIAKAGSFDGDIDYGPVDPCHQEYLKAMGVSFSIVFPIVLENQLWGLLVCHHSVPVCISQRQMQIVQLLVDQISIAIAQSQLLQRATEQAKQEAVLNKISSLLYSSSSFDLIQQTVLEEISEALNANGGRLYLKPLQTPFTSQLYTHGVQPPLFRLEQTPFWQEIIDSDEISLGQSEANSPFSSTSQVYEIPDLYQEPKIGNLASIFKLTPIRSLLIIPLRYHQQCIGCLTLFRHEIETETLWAGRNHPDSRNSLPRQSFEAWREVVRGQALPWRADEIKLARTLGIHLYTAVMERRLKEMILHHSYHDSLTGLPNRLLFHERLSLALANIQLTPGEVLAVIFLDLDGFKTINDTLGHAVGDELLKRVAERLINLLNIDDTIARWGGDEFTILLSSLPNVEKASTIALKILAALSVPFHFHEQELYIKGSLGIAIAPYHGNDAETLLKHADAALHGAKQQGRNTYQLYNTAIGSKVEKRLAIENNLYKAIEREEFILYYQPQFCLKTGKIVGVEALIRWQSRELGFVSPAQFIPLAEETGAIIPIGEWVLQTACLQHRYWQELGLSPIQVAINLSGRQFQDQRLLKMIQRVLETTGMNPNYLEFEITESIAIQDTGLTISILNKLRELGVQTSIDDFGTGYSSLSSLKHFPLDKIKIDQSFIRDLTTDSHDAAIVRAVVALGHGLDLKVVAEGVETEEQYQFLKSLKCNVVQGYYLSRPLAAQMITSLLLEKQGKLEKSQSK